MDNTPYQDILIPDWLSEETWNHFWDKVEITTHGYLWTAATDGHGYGRFWIPEKQKLYSSHRLVFEWKTGVIPQVIDHTCSVRRCLTLEHLEDVTQAENIQRTYERGKGNHYYARQTHCKHGHEWTPENTRIVNKTHGGTQRICRTCQRETMREVRAR